MVVKDFNTNNIIINYQIVNNTYLFFLLDLINNHHLNDYPDYRNNPNFLYY